ncbi:MAG: endonuclease domain-containing protein [Eubacterium sp.]|nr:endonuclease domain-containing protein [Eubacterium sp.]
MDRKHNKSLVQNAKELRKNMTKEERHLWYDFLRGHQARFTRQKVLGKYIVDFYSARAKMIIELDGSQHFEESGQTYDAKRDEYLKAYGLTVIRIPNNEIYDNFDGVCEYLDDLIKQSLSQQG